MQERKKHVETPLTEDGELSSFREELSQVRAEMTRENKPLSKRNPLMILKQKTLEKNSDLKTNVPGVIVEGGSGSQEKKNIRFCEGRCVQVEISERRVASVVAKNGKHYCANCFPLD